MIKTKENLKYISFIFVYSIIKILLRINVIKNISINNSVNIYTFLFLGIMSFIFFYDWYRDGIDKWKKNSSKTLLLVLIMFLVKLILTTIASIPLGIFYPDYESINSNNIELVVKTFPIFISIISIGILGPIVEETVFRGILVGKLKEYIPSTICVIISSVLFMFLHVRAITTQELLYCLPYFVTGILYSIIFLKTKNITISMMLHIINNLLPLIMMIIAMK